MYTDYYSYSNSQPTYYSYPYQGNVEPSYSSTTSQSGDRIIGGALAPFLLGGIAGAALTSPYFYRPPYYGGYYPYPPAPPCCPYPPYPYYR